MAGSDPIISNTTITNNESSNDNNEKGIELYNTANVTLINSIITGQNNDPIYFNGSNLDYPSFITISYSLIEGGQDSIVTNDNGTVTWGDGNVDIDPLFMDVDNDDYHLLASSQCINGGDPATFDSDGSRADMGAYPYLNSYSGPTWYINESGNDTDATGASGDPFRSIQAGINFSSDADSVTVAAGTYVENINFRGRNIKVVGASRETTIIDGDSSGSVVVFENLNNEFNHQYQDAVLKNFTITNGSGWSDGSGIKLHYFSSPTLSDLIISNNTSYQAAGGIDCESMCHPNIENVIVSNNTSSTAGGIMCFGGSNPTLTNVTITGNTAYNGGGVFCFNNSHPTLTDVTISGNSADNMGGGFQGSSSDVKLRNVTIKGNTTSGEGGGLHFWNPSNADFTNVVISGNAASFFKQKTAYDILR